MSQYLRDVFITAQKMKFSIKDFFSKYDQISRKLQIWSHLLKKSLMESYIFRAVYALPSRYSADARHSKYQLAANLKYHFQLQGLSILSHNISCQLLAKICIPYENFPFLG